MNAKRLLEVLTWAYFVSFIAQFLLFIIIPDDIDLGSAFLFGGLLMLLSLPLMVLSPYVFLAQDYYAVPWGLLIVQFAVVVLALVALKKFRMDRRWLYVWWGIGGGSLLLAFYNVFPAHFSAFHFLWEVLLAGVYLFATWRLWRGDKIDPTMHSADALGERGERR